jgi:hypothetical protein
MPRRAGVCLAVLLAVNVGCVSARPDERVAVHRAGELADTTTVSYLATYVLCCESPAGAAQPADHANTVFQWTSANGSKGQTASQPAGCVQLCELAHNEAIGFRWAPNGQLYAVAGGEEFPLEDGDYFWAVTPETARHGTDRVWHEVSERVPDHMGLHLEIPALWLPILMELGSGGWG